MFKPPPRGIRRQPQVLDRTRPISTLFEVTSQEGGSLVQWFEMCLKPLS